MFVLATGLSDSDPRRWVAGLLGLCGLYLLGCVLTSSATGEMTEGRESGPTRVVHRDQDPRRFAFMLGTCVFGAVVCFATAGYVLIGV